MNREIKKKKRKIVIRFSSIQKLNFLHYDNFILLRSYYFLGYGMILLIFFFLLKFVARFYDKNEGDVWGHWNRKLIIFINCQYSFLVEV
jgi:hypothetical protein